MSKVSVLNHTLRLSVLSAPCLLTDSVKTPSLPALLPSPRYAKLIERRNQSSGKIIKQEGLSLGTDCLK